MEKKFRQRKEGEQSQYVNEQLRYQDVVDRSAIKPIQIRSQVLRKRYNTDSVQVLNVQSIDEAAAQASLMHIDAGQLIKETSDIMRTQDTE